MQKNLRVFSIFLLIFFSFVGMSFGDPLFGLSQVSTDPVLDSIVAVGSAVLVVVVLEYGFRHVMSMITGPGSDQDWVNSMSPEDREFYEDHMARQAEYERYDGAYLETDEEIQAFQDSMENGGSLVDGGSDGILVDGKVLDPNTGEVTFPP